MSASSDKTASEKHEIKRLEIIRIASLMMNEQGATSIKLSAVAKSAGLSRNALYYYFNDRTDLIFACYLNASEATSADFLKVQEGAAGARRKLNDYIDLTLLGAGAERALLTDVDLLPQSAKETILDIRERNIRSLESIITEGMESGEIGKVSPVITAQIIQGMLNWAQLWYRWADFQADELNSHYTVAAKGIKRVIFNGLISAHDFDFKCDLHFPMLMNSRVNAFDPKSLHQEKRSQLIGAASFLFNCKGINAVSLDDIADYIGATKGAVYHYFKDKQTLIAACFARAFEQYERIIEIASQSDGDPLSQLLVVLHLNCQAQLSNTPPLILHGGTSSFALKYADRSRAIAQKLDQICSRAVHAGLDQNIDRNVISLAAGTFFWIPTWYAKQSAIDGKMLADEICRVVFKGISSDAPLL
jgi:AcrR family transcriptional regulator